MTQFGNLNIVIIFTWADGTELAVALFPLCMDIAHPMCLNDNQREIHKF